MINHVIHQRYEIVEKAGESALFTVYKARDKVQNQVLAVKAVQPPFAGDKGFIESLKAGIAAAGNLNNPNITRVYEMGEDNGVPFFVTEFVRGINLKERIRRIAPFTLSVAVDFVCSIAEALHYAHSVGQVHGDLRPHNIIISPEGSLKVTDFGVQRAIARAPGAQREKLLRGSPYHAPELSTTQPGSVSGDIYALGAILYEMMTGTPLYAAESLEATAEQHAFAAIPSPRVINPGVPRSIEGIILKCLQKKPEQRYRSAGDLLNDLKSVRDALRFGKPLSWSPMEVEKLAAASAIPLTPPAAVDETATVASVAGAKKSASAIPLAPPSMPEPVADVAASSMPAAMPTRNRLRAVDERVSIYIKLAIGTVTVIIVACLICFSAIWFTMWVPAKPVPLQKLTGKTIEEARQLAKQMHVSLVEHSSYMDKPRNIVYKTDHDNDPEIRPGRKINIWYSLGPDYVNVPNLTGIPREEAEKKLLDTGLKLGKVMPEFSAAVASGAVIRQNVSWKKRVFHDTAVDLTVSDGPKPDFATTDNANTNPDPNPPDTTQNDTATNTPDNGTNPPVTNPTDLTPHTFDRTISIPTDHLGTRQVRIEYSDTNGEHSPPIDEPHGEGDKIHVTFDYTGKEITLRIFYDNALKWSKKFDPQNKGRIQ